MPFEGISTLGYDNAKKTFFSTWIDNMGNRHYGNGRELCKREINRPCDRKGNSGKRNIPDY